MGDISENGGIITSRNLPFNNISEIMQNLTQSTFFLEFCKIAKGLQHLRENLWKKNIPVLVRTASFMLF